MRYVTVLLRHGHGVLHPVERRLAEDHDVTRRAMDAVEELPDGSIVFLTEVAGDLDRYAELMADSSSVHDFAVAGDDSGFCYSHVDPSPQVERLLRARREAPFVVELPVQKTEDGAQPVTPVGRAEAFAGEPMDLPDGVEMEPGSTGPYSPAAEGVFSALTDRQREVPARPRLLRDAPRSGPRGVGSELGIEPGTAGNLRAVESKGSRRASGEVRLAGGPHCPEGSVPALRPFMWSRAQPSIEMKIRQTLRHWAMKQALSVPILGDVTHDKLVDLHVSIFLDYADESHREARRTHLADLFDATVDTYLVALRAGYPEAEAREITHIQANFDFYNHGWTEMMEFPADELEAHYARYREFFEAHGITIDDPLGEFRPAEGIATAPSTPEALDDPDHPHAEGGFADDVYVEGPDGEVRVGGAGDEPADVSPTDAPGVDAEEASASRD